MLRVNLRLGFSSMQTSVSPWEAMQPSTDAPTHNGTSSAGRRQTLDKSSLQWASGRSANAHCPSGTASSFLLPGSQISIRDDALFTTLWPRLHALAGIVQTNSRQPGLSADCECNGEYTTRPGMSHERAVQQ